MILTTGIGGTPMKSYNHLNDKERWDLASFIESKINKKLYKPAEYEIDLKTHVINEEIDMDPNNSLWDSISVQNIHTIPLNARRDQIDQIQFQSVMNDEVIACLLYTSDAADE